MARGTKGKLRQKDLKKEARASEAARLLEEKTTGVVGNDFEATGAELPVPPGMNVDPGNHATVDSDSSVEEAVPTPQKAAKKKKKKKSVVAPMIPPPPAGKKIKTLPLVMLILLTGSTLLPAMIYASDWMGNMVQKHHMMGALGHKLGIGAAPKKRVISFYEKHDPDKLEDVPKIMSKYYGDYEKLVKRLERRYQDYGYFSNWEQDEAPMKLAMEKFSDTYDSLGTMWMKHAPQFVKSRARNARYNFKYIYKKGYKLWKKRVWPVLEPYFGVPDGSAAQKKKDSKKGQAGKKKRSKKNDYRDDDEM